MKFTYRDEMSATVRETVSNIAMIKLWIVCETNIKFQSMINNDLN